jgi:hypothetical protein
VKAAFLLIVFNGSMLKSTFNGFIYNADKCAIKQISGFDTKHTHYAGGKKYYSKLDICVLKSIMQHFLVRYNYEAEPGFLMWICFTLFFLSTKREFLNIIDLL